jgi:hypothetical protein
MLKLKLQKVKIVTIIKKLIKVKEDELEFRNCFLLAA